MKKLSEPEIGQLLERLPGWSRQDDKWIARSYRFPTFPDGIAFVNEVARIAEKLNHHPMIAIDYRMVTLRLTTWSAGGLTELDVQSAAMYDQAFGR